MSDRPILTWEDGKPVKFFIQKDLPIETLENISKQITEHGGIVQTKVPRQGFVLIAPESPEGFRLVGCWDTAECPERFFVPFFFVDACIREGRLIPQVFRRGSKSVGIYVHESVDDRERLCNSIWCSGGNPVATGSEVSVIVADSDWFGFQTLVGKFSHSKKTYIEDVPWIENCIKSGEYKHTPLVKKNLGGRMSGSKRTEFAERDDKNLAAYIASRLPEREMRGRTGNKIYRDLCDLSLQYPWAARHPWQSWRERYKNNVYRFDTMIKEYLKKHPTPEDRKGVHGFVRVPPSSNKALTPAKKKAVSSGPEDDGWESQWEIREGKKSPPAWSKRKDPQDREASESPPKRQRTKERADQEMAQPVTGSFLQVANRQGTAIPSYQNSNSRASNGGDIQDDDDYVEETDEAEDSMGTQTQALLEANKEFIRRTNSENGLGKQDFRDVPQPSSTTNEDVVLAGIASKYGFLLSEVIQEFNDLSCDLDATRLFFQEIREYIQQKKAHRK